MITAPMPSSTASDSAKIELAKAGTPVNSRSTQPTIQTETLGLLEWSRLCQQVASFASTPLGRIATEQLVIPDSVAGSEALLIQTKEVYEFEQTEPQGLNFRGIGNIDGALERAERQGVLSGEELLTIAQTLAGLRNLRKQISSREDACPVLMELVSSVRTLPDLEKEINHCIDDRGEVADRASTKLGGIRDGLKQVRSQIRKKLQNIMQQKPNAVQESTIVMRGDRFALPVKAGHKSNIRGIVHDTSASGGTLYIEPHAVVESNNKLRQLTRQEAAEEEAIRRRLSELVAEDLPELERVLAIATTIDLAAARARYSFWLEANPPRFIDPRGNETTTLRNLRHPLLVWQATHDEGAAVVPIDVAIDPQIRVVAITGPNTGGKTVTLKTLGLAALMAKAGLFVPAREPVELPWFEQVLADIGDEQSIEQNLSTFSGHIRRIVRILKALKPAPPKQQTETQETNESDAGLLPNAVETEEESPEFSPLPEIHELQEYGGDRSLVLLDEVGAGTDPAEGSALATSLLTKLADRAQLTVATTHFGELKTLKYQDERFENASVEFDDRTLSPTYKLLWGIPGRSNALTIAKRLGLDRSVVNSAQKLVGGFSEDINRTIAGLEAQHRQQESKSNQAQHLLERAQHLHQQIDKKAKALKEREDQLRQSQEEAVRAAVNDAKKEINQVIRRLKKGEITGQAAQKAGEELGAIAEKRLPSQQAKKRKPTYKPTVGERIRVLSLGSTAEVLDVDEADQQLTVRMGILKATVPMNDIESLKGEKVEPPPKKAARVSQKPKQRTILRTSKTSVDIRGARVTDSEPIIDKLISQAIAADQGAIWVIHGKGTGKLREGVQGFLKQHALVERYEIAEKNDGGAGVTIAYLK
ncbi:MAG: endonuclease MutS2 [Cyanobacteria bacterium P01_C01_bin.89]